MSQGKKLSDCGDLSGCQPEIMKYIPGGICKCRADEELTILGTGKGFLNLSGYSEEEIQQKFNGYLLKMIDQEDRKKVQETIGAQLSAGDKITVEYRIQRCDGKSIRILNEGQLVHEEDDTDVLYCIMSDITKQYEEKEQLRLSLERHRVIMDQMAETIFEWDIRNDTIFFSANWNKKFGYMPIHERVSYMLPRSENIHPEERRHLKSIMRNIVTGVPYAETEMRIRNAAGVYISCRIRVTTQFGDNGAPVRAIGVISDISREKNQRQMLKEQARRDSLTGLLHKNAARKAMENWLEQTDKVKGAMIIIDLDNFKAVNDQYGHLCGDALIADTAGVLHRIFRDSEIISRVGGDEFLVFLSQAGNEEIKKRIEALNSTLSDINVSGRSGIVSCSAGIALLPEHAVDFNGLFKCADLALYKVKSSGKGAMAFYYPGMEEKGFLDRAAESSAGSAIDSDQKTATELLGQYCFRILYDAPDMVAMIYNVLDFIGRAYDVSRAYIVENSRDGLQSRNTFEWCNKGVKSLKDRCLDQEYGEIAVNYSSNFSENGVFSCSDVSCLELELSRYMKKQGVSALIQCAIMEKGSFGGYIGFDECRGNRMWTPDQIEMLSLASKIISTFLLNHRLEERLKIVSPDK